MGNAPIGVFDSGIGGLSVLRALRAELPHERYVYFADSGHAPYGERGDAFVIERSLAITADLIERQGIKALVVACNTATAAAIHTLRQQHPLLPIVGVEPALKPALAVTRTRRVGVWATRGTLESPKFAALRASLGDQAEFVTQACDGLALAIEQQSTEPERVPGLCKRYLDAMGRFGTGAGEIDTLVLGCTHYVFVRETLAERLGPGVALVDTGAPVARQTRRLLADAHLLAHLAEPALPAIEWLGTGSATQLATAASRWQI
ncbi:MAG TPA: glutamate racemase [Burkholderiaceae bacterium]|nr:glutamate racemase [Burkholderiaceae bacterium]